MLTFESKRTILFARYTMSSVAISIFPEFIDKIETLELSELFEITKSEIINKSTGSKIIFKGIKAGSGVQTANLKSIANVDTLVIEEGEEIPDEETFDKIDLSIRSNRHFNKVIVLFNPTTKASWIYDRFFGRCGVEPGSNVVESDTTYIHTSYLDIIDQLPNSIIAALKKIKRDNPKKYEHIVLGGFLDVAEGVVFTNWKMGDFNSDIDSDFGADFGYSNDPNTLVEVAIDRKARKIWIKEHLYSTMSVANPKERMGTSELANIFRRHAGSKLIIGDSAEGRLIDEIKKTGVNIKPCVKGAGSVKEGILLLQDFEMIIDPDSKNLIKELNNYVWAEKGEKPVDMYNHLCDPLRYVVTHRLKEKLVDKFAISGVNRLSRLRISGIR